MGEQSEAAAGPHRAAPASGPGGVHARGGPARLPYALTASAAAGLTELQVLRRLGGSLKGLTEDEAGRRLMVMGANRLPATSLAGWWRQGWGAVRDRYTAVLVTLSGIAAVTRAAGTAAALAGLVVVSCVLRWADQRRVNRAGRALRALPAGTATVLRRTGRDRAGLPREVPVDDVVPGDIVRVSPGDLVPADLLLLRSSGLMVTQAGLTGESQPVAKAARPGPVPPPGGGRGAASGRGVLADPRLCFRGSSVTAGCGTAVVLATGADTFLGAACRSGQVVRRATAVDRTTRSVAGLLIRLTLVALTGAVSVLALAGRDPLTVFPFCVAVAVGLTPEMLPVVVSAALAGARGGLRRRKVIVKRLSAVHDLGAVDVVCADKTGTLTRDRLTVAAGVDPAGSPDPHVVGWAGLNSTISAQLGDPPVVDGIDQALIEALDGPEQTGAGPGASAWVGERVLPFDPVRRCASVVVTARDRPASRVLIVKGAVREVLARCTRWQDGGGCHPLDAAGRAAAGTVADRLAAQGLRVVAVARSAAHPGSPPARPGRGPIRESDLTLLGFVGLCEEPEPTAPAVLAELPEHGIAVKIITGDQARTVVRACADLGVLVERVVTGHDLDDLDDEAVTALARTGTVFAECTPAHKARIVQALRTAGHTVAYLGDGANDAAALRVADVGICPLGGVQAARADADVLLGEHGVAAVGRAVSAGRRAVTNIGTYLRITLACNVGNVIAMVISGATLPFLPMLPAQVLVQNICFDAAQVPLAFDRPAPGHPHSPLDWRRLGREALLLGLVNAAADLATFALIARLSSSAGGTSAAIFFHSGWFSENLLTQAITVHVLRGWTSGRGSRTPWPVRTACLGLAGTGLVLPVSPAAGPLGLHPMPAGYYLGLVPILAGYATVLLILRARTRRPRA